jgi:hypothetical protein
MQVGFAVCEWFHAHDLPSRRQHDDLSLKYYLTSGPQLAAALLLLYYAFTFLRRGSEFVHQLLVESCLHQSLTSLLVVAVLHSGLHMTHSACCAYPAFWCVVMRVIMMRLEGNTAKANVKWRIVSVGFTSLVDVTACELHAIFQCPKRLESFAHYDLGFRSAQFLATCVLLAAMASVAPVHRLRHLMSRFRRAEFLTFDRRRPAALVTPPSLQPSSNE